MSTEINNKGKPTDAYVEYKLLSCAQVQGLLGISKTSLFNILRDKKDPIPSFKIGKNRKFKLDKVLWWIDKHEE